MADDLMSPSDPSAYQKIVGATFAKTEHRAIIVIGNRSWSKWDLGRIGCPHPSAAARIQQVIQQLDIRTTKQFLDQAHEFGKYRSLGVTSYWTVLALARELGADIEQVHGEDVSFRAIHRRALKNGSAGTRRKKRRNGRA
jgi:hypothetical protein